MKQEYKILLLGFLTITLFDVLSSIASKQLNFNYSLLASISYIIYGAFGFIATKEKSLKVGILIAAAIGFFDSTVGWKISMLLGVNTDAAHIKITPLLWFVTSIFVTGSAAVAGLVGGGLAIAIKKKAETPPDASM